MDLRRLRGFVAVATERSFSRAADVLGVAQPPLSRQVMQLEKDLGVRLIDRTRPITLTPAGAFVFEQASQIFAKLSEIEEAARRIGRGAATQIGVGFVGSTLYRALPDAIRRLRSEAPEVEVTLVELTTYEQAAALKAGRLDVGFGRLPFEDERLARKTLLEEPLVVAAPSASRLPAMLRPL